MFEKEIKFISDFTINKINYLGSFFTYDELFNSDINPAILKFVSAEVDFKIYEDRKKFLSHSSFNYTGSKIAKYFNLIGKEIKKSTKITYHDIKDIINQAVAFNIDYTIVPNESLLNLFFDKKQEIKAEALKLKLNYIYYYPHLKEILSSYIDKKNVSVLTSSAVKKILSDINDQVLAEAPESAVEDAINTIADFYNIGNTGSQKLSARLVEIYLEKNHFEKYLDRLNKSILHDSKQKHSIGEIKAILFSSAPVKGIEETKPEENELEEEPLQPEDAETQITEEKDNIEEPQKEAINQSETQDEETEVSDEKEVEFDITEHENLDALYSFNEEEPEENVPAKENDEIVIEKEEVSDELESSEEFREKEEENAPVIHNEIDKPLNENEIFKSDAKLLEEKEDLSKEDQSKKTRDKDIFSYLTDKEIERIVGNVFNDDRDDFAGTMEKITDSSSYEEATEILKSVFKSYNVNPYSRDAITFTNSVSNYFEQA